MNSTTTCTFQYELVAGSVDSYPVIATSSCVSFIPETGTSSPMIMTYQETLFIWCVVIGILSMMVWGSILPRGKSKFHRE